MHELSLTKIEGRYSASPSFERVITYIDKNYMHKLTLGDVAKNTYYHETYISQMFVKKMGISFSCYLESVRLSKAKTLLYDTNEDIAEIAKEVGYSSSSYFSKAFKKRVGVSPREYRDTMLDSELKQDGG